MNVLRLVEQLAVEVPLPAELATAARVDERPHEAAVEQRQPGHREPRRHRDLVRAVAVHAARRRAVERGVDVADDVDRHLRAVGGGGPHAFRDVRRRGRRSGSGVCLSTVRSPVATSTSNTAGGVVSDWCVNRTTSLSHCGFAPNSTSWGSASKSSTCSAAVAEQDAQSRLGVGPLVEREVAGERLAPVMRRPGSWAISSVHVVGRGRRPSAAITTGSRRRRGW